jgi:hypothetical protein
VNGPPLTHSEVVATLERAIAQFEGIGLDRDAAITAVANRYGVAPERIAPLTTDPSPVLSSVEGA